MAKNTEYLVLYEKESTDGKDTFNIKTMLNDNWDKIDADAKSKNASVEDINNTIGTAALATTDKTIKGAINEVKENIPTSLPASGGHASTADKWQTARNIALSGDVTGNVNFDGSANANIATSLKNSGVNAGTYRSVTVDVKGRVTAGTNPTTRDGYGLTDVYTKTEVDNKSSFNREDITGQTLDLNNLNLSSGSLLIKYYINKTKSGSTNIENMPETNTEFILNVELIRYVSSTDYALKQTFVSLGTQKTYERFYDNTIGKNTWSTWMQISNKDDVDAHIADTSKHIPYLGTTTNSGNVYTISAPGISMHDGNAFRVKFNAQSTGAISLKINSTGGAVPVYDFYGNAVTNVKQYTMVTLLVNINNGVWSFTLDGKGGDGTALPEHILAGDTATTSKGKITGTMPNNGNTVLADSYRITSSGDLIGNIGILLRFSPGYYSAYSDGLFPSAQVAEPNLMSANIKAGKSIFGVSGNSNVVDTSDATAVATDIRDGKTVYIKGNKVTGTKPVQATGAQTITPGTSDIVKPAGIYDGPITVKGGYAIRAGDFSMLDGYNASTVNNSTLGTTYTRCTDIMKIQNSGKVRISFSILGGSSSNVSYAQIYKNGSPVGTERSQTGGEKIYTEDIDVSVGDELAVYSRNQYTASSGNGYIYSFSLAIRNIASWES